MNEQTRYRVTGSLFLLALAVVCLPMIFDGDGLPSVNIDPLTPVEPLPDVQPLADVAPESDFIEKIDELRDEVDDEGFHRDTRTKFGEPVLSEVAEDTDTWAVQVASFEEASNANRMQTELRNAGYEAFLSTSKTGNAVHYRVAVGPLLSKVDADSLQTELSAQFDVNARLMAFSH